MKLIKPLAAAAALVFLAACGTPDRIAVQPPAISETVRIGFASVEVKDVSLPSYAAADEVAQQAIDGSLITSKVLWADAPERAIGLELSRNLAQLTKRRIASEPWPFEEDAAATLINGNLTLEGNSAPLIEFQHILADLDIDWEAPLVSSLGDVAGHQIAEILKRVFSWGRQASSGLARQVEEFIHEEARLSPPKLEMEDFYRDIADLVMRVDRLQSRVERISRKLKTS